MSQKFNFQEYISQIPQLNSEKDIDTFFNVMNVVANLSIPIGQKTALLNQMESKLKDNPKFQEIADSHKPQIEKMQQVMANLVQNLEEKKEQAKKQQQEIKTGQQFNLQQLNMLKGVELVQYIVANMNDPSQWDKMSQAKQQEAIKETFNHFSELVKTESGKQGVAKVLGSATKNEKQYNASLDAAAKMSPEEGETFVAMLLNDKEFANTFYRYAGCSNDPKKQKLLTNAFVSAVKIGAEHNIKLHYENGKFFTEPDTEEARIKLKKLIDEKITQETDPRIKDALEFTASELINTELDKKHIFTNKNTLKIAKPATEVYKELQQQLDQAVEIYQKYDSHSKWDIINIVRADHQSDIGQLVHSQVTMYLVGENKDILNNEFFRDLYAKSKAQENDHALFRNVLTGMWFDEKITDKVLSLLDQDLVNNPAIQPNQTKIDKNYCDHYVEEKNNFYYVAGIITNSDNNPDSKFVNFDVYDLFRKIKQGEELTEKDVKILNIIRNIQDDPDKQHLQFVKGVSITITKSEFLEKFYKGSKLTPDKLDKLIENASITRKSNHISENESLIAAVADIEKSRSVAQEYHRKYGIISMEVNKVEENEKEDQKENYITNSNLNT
ncbi:hypothetical protein FW755_11880 [Lonepinella koalarum]|uniref:hypothetical protein n=1 Tax=Lonepinella koalarum TaxID=53417 RepID=UPI0011E426AB|nr:hypothetical protein [Lonepinella koalarum]TYG33446.1 hypothetical protein FW755_11880 [Lonepinella koalarum]